MAQARGDAVEEGLDADEARVRVRGGLGDEMLAAAEADFEDERRERNRALPPCGGGLGGGFPATGAAFITPGARAGKIRRINNLGVLGSPPSQPSPARGGGFWGKGGGLLCSSLHSPQFGLTPSTTGSSVRLHSAIDPA